MAWSFQSAHSEQNNGSSFVEDDWEMPFRATRLMQFWFRIDGTSFGEPFPLADFSMQIDAGAGFAQFDNAKNVDPFRAVGFLIQDGDLIQKLTALGVPPVGTYPIRLEVSWPGGPYYSNTINVTITAPTVLPGGPGVELNVVAPSGPSSIEKFSP